MSLRRSLAGPEQSDRSSQSSTDASSDWEIVSWKEETQQSGQGKFPDINNDSVDAEDHIMDLTRNLEMQSAGSGKLHKSSLLFGCCKSYVCPH